MRRFLSAAIAALLSGLALYAARTSYIAIVNLRRYEAKSERAAKHSETAAHELYKTRVTQASSAAAIALSLISSLALLFRTLPASSPYSRILDGFLPPLNIVAIAAAFLHNQDYWKAKGKVPFVGGFNEGIERSKEIRQLMGPLGAGWAVVGLLHLSGL